MPYKGEIINVTNIDGLWPHVAKGLDKACVRTGGDIDAPYLWSQCRSGGAFLHIVLDEAEKTIAGASVWRFDKWTSGRKLKCLALYGRDISQWIDVLQSDARELCRVGGASSAVFDGREGWVRLFPEARLIKQTYEIML